MGTKTYHVLVTLRDVYLRTHKELPMLDGIRGVASGLVNTEHVLPDLDGEMYLRKAVVSDQLPVTSKNPTDVNGDGVVNVFDSVFVAGEM